MPSKNSKDLISRTLVETLSNMLAYLESIVSDSDCEPAAKRQKMEASDVSDKYARSQKTTRSLQKKGVLAIGLRDTTQALLSA